MIYERIVDFDTVQISLFKQKNEKAWFPIRFFSNLTARRMNADVCFYPALQHNANYVSTAAFGGLFHIMSRIFSMRWRCSVPVEMI